MKTQEHLISKEITAFIIDRQARQLSPRSIQFYQNELDWFLAWCAPQRISTMTAITPDLLRQYLIDLATHRNPQGVHASYRALKAFLNWYTFELDLDPRYNPIRKVSPPRINTDPLPGIPTAHIQAMLATCTHTHLGQRDRAMILFLLDTGLRKTEFTRLNYGNIDLKTGAVTILKGKGAKDRTVFLGNRCRRELIRYLRYRGDLAPNSPLFTKSTLERLTPAGLRQVIRRRSLQANIPDPQVHDFRRTFAIECLRNGVDLITLMRLMGHTDTKVLQRYLKLLDTDLRSSHERTSPADAL